MVSSKIQSEYRVFKSKAILQQNINKVKLKINKINNYIDNIN